MPISHGCAEHDTSTMIGKCAGQLEYGERRGFIG
jgi:hypothetical protein